MSGFPQWKRIAEIDWLAWRLQELLRERPRSRAAGLLSVTLELPVRLQIGVPPLRDGDLLCSHPAGGGRLFGRGLLQVAEARGEDRLVRLARRLEELVAGWEHLDPDGSHHEPALFVGFAFDPGARMRGEWTGFPNSALFLPSLLLRQRGDVAHVTFSCREPGLDPARQCGEWLDRLQSLLYPVIPLRRSGPPGPPCSPETTPGDPEWLGLSRRALETIGRGELCKLVLCRKVRRFGMARLQRATLIERLERGFPDCRIFAVARGEALLVSASPERLVSKAGRRVVCDAVAGTVGRARGTLQDLHLERMLYTSPKLREEQAVVAGAIREVLAPFCSGLSQPAVPGIRRLQNVQHLWSEIGGTLVREVGLLELAARLHPTPAVGGMPRAAALEWLNANEPLQRGWYSGAGGWVDRAGDGELSVLLRCALLQGDRADLYAGAGLVEGSDPAEELAETELKLSALSGPLSRS